jgi:hypothetical protein
MQKELIQNLLRAAGMSTTITEEEFDRYLGKLKFMVVPDEVRVVNLIELEALRKEFFPSMLRLGAFPSGFDFVWKGGCERLFIDQMYGTCCVWTRAMLERELYEICLSSKEVAPAFKQEILSDHTPGIKRAKEALSDALTPNDDLAIGTIQTNGDWIVHRNLRKIVGGKEHKEMLREFGVADENLDNPGFKAAGRVIIATYALLKERDMAKSSVKALYGFLSRHRSWSDVFVALPRKRP